MGYTYTAYCSISAMPAELTAPSIPLAELLESWKHVLQAENKAQPTYTNYTTGVMFFIRWCEARGETPRIDRELVIKWVADSLASGLQTATVTGRQLAIRRFSAWMSAEDGIDYTDQLLGIKPPKAVEKLIELSEKELKLMIAACEGKALRDRRDEAIIRLMAETGMRSRRGAPPGGRRYRHERTGRAHPQGQVGPGQTGRVQPQVRRGARQVPTPTAVAS